MPSETEKAWFAGFLDGEGYIQISQYKGWYTLIVRISNLHLPTLLKIKALWGKGAVKLVPNAPTHGPFWRWHVKANQALEILEDVFPYLVTKRAEAETAIAFQRNHTSRKRSNQYTPGRAQENRNTDKILKEALECIRKSTKESTLKGGD